MHQNGQPKFRKDIVEGTTGVIEGWPDLEQRQVLLTIILDLPSGPKQAITKEVYPRNLKLTSEYLLAKAATAPDKDCPNSKDSQCSKGPRKDNPHQCPAWAQGSSDPDLVKCEPHFKHLLADSDRAAKFMYLKARIGVGLEALSESLPKH
jgi:hypothetical protein